MAFSKHSAGLSFQCAVALTPLTNTLAIDGEFLSCSMASGFVLALGGPICEIKIPVQEL